MMESPRQRTDAVRRAMAREEDRKRTAQERERERAIEKDYQETIKTIDDQIEAAVAEGKYFVDVSLARSSCAYQPEDLHKRVLAYCIKSYDKKGDFTAGECTYRWTNDDGYGCSADHVQIRWDGKRPQEEW